MNGSEIARYAGSIIGRKDDEDGVFCIVTFKELEGDFYIPVDHFECDKIGYGQPVYAIIEEDSNGERTMRCIQRIIELTPERKRLIQNIEKLLKDC